MTGIEKIPMPGRPRKDGTRRFRYLNPMIFMETADSVGGACANISGKSQDEIRHIRDWCNFLLIKKVTTA